MLGLLFASWNTCGPRSSFAKTPASGVQGRPDTGAVNQAFPPISRLIGTSAGTRSTRSPSRLSPRSHQGTDSIHHTVVDELTDSAVRRLVGVRQPKSGPKVLPVVASRLTVLRSTCPLSLSLSLSLSKLFSIPY